MGDIQKPTPLEGIRYFDPPAGYILTGRDGKVSIPWDDNPLVPLLEDEFPQEQEDVPGYDAVGRGIYQALRINPECVGAAKYAAVLRDAYPHVIAELGGQIVMLDAKEVDTPYLDRKINLLKIMALIEPDNAGLQLEIARTFTEKGVRLSTLHQAVTSWYNVEKHLIRVLELEPDNVQASYLYGEALYVLGRYNHAAEIWQGVSSSLNISERRTMETRIAAILAGKLPLVPPLDYLTALAIAIEEHQQGRNDEAVAIIEDVLADSVFTSQFPMDEIFYILGTCYQELGMMEAAARSFKRS